MKMCAYVCAQNSKEITLDLYFLSFFPVFSSYLSQKLPLQSKYKNKTIKERIDLIKSLK